MVNGECVLTIPILTSTALRTPFLYHAWTRSLTRRPGAYSSLFLTVLRVPSDRPKGVGLGEDVLHHPLRGLLLQHHDVWPQERGCYLPEGHSESLQGQIGCNAEVYIDDVVV